MLTRGSLRRRGTASGVHPLRRLLLPRLAEAAHRGCPHASLQPEALHRVSCCTGLAGQAMEVRQAQSPACRARGRLLHLMLARARLQQMQARAGLHLMWRPQQQVQRMVAGEAELTRVPLTVSAMYSCIGTIWCPDWQVRQRPISIIDGGIHQMPAHLRPAYSCGLISCNATKAALWGLSPTAGRMPWMMALLCARWTSLLGAAACPRASSRRAQPSASGPSSTSTQPQVSCH